MESVSPDTLWIIGTVVTAAVALAGVMYALVSGTHRRIDDVRGDLNRLHEDHVRLDERLRAAEMRPRLGIVQTREAE